jgi:hypothetical protein
MAVMAAFRRDLCGRLANDFNGCRSAAGFFYQLKNFW